MADFDSIYSDVDIYRSRALLNMEWAIDDMTSAVSNWYSIAFPKEGAPTPQLSFNKNSQSLQLDSPDYSGLDPYITSLSNDTNEFQSKLNSISVPNIVIDFVKNKDLTAYGDAKTAANYDPTTSFNSIRLESLSDLTSNFCSFLNTTQSGYRAAVDYYIESYITGISVLDQMYDKLTLFNRDNFNLDVNRVNTRENNEFDYKVRSATLDTYKGLSNIELNFVSNMASLYLKIVKTLLDRNTQEAALWREEKELLVKYEWDKYTTTVKGFSEEFELLMQTATTKIKNDIKAITENYLIELDKFETNLRALEATANIEKISGAVELDAYQMKLLKLESKYKSALQTSRGEYKALMDTTVAAFSSIASELQTAVPTGIALLTSKN